MLQLHHIWLISFACWEISAGMCSWKNLCDNNLSILLQSSESVRTKMKMEKDLAKVKNIMAGLSEEGARLQEMMSTLRKPKPGAEPTSPGATLPKCRS